MGDKLRKIICVPNGEIGPKETISYTLGAFGQGMIYSMIGTYLMIFYTDVLRVSPAKIGVMFLVAKLFDAVNDFAMGAIVDRTRTRFGKMRPYLLIAPIPLALTTTMVFVAPNLSESGKLIYMYITFILWGLTYTLSDVPYTSLSAAITSNQEERTKLITVVKLIGGLSYNLPFLLIPLLMSFKNRGIAPLLTGSSARVYTSSAIIFSVLGAVCILICFWGTKERVPQSEVKPTLKDSAQYLIRNKPLLLVLLCNLLAFPRSIQAVTQTYVATYLMGGAEKILLLGVPMVIGSITGMAFTPAMVRRFGAIKTYIYATIFSVIPFTIEFFIGFRNIPMLLVFSFLFTLIISPMGVVTTLLISDCIDYMEVKTGQRSEGISFSVQTFMSKATAALQSLVVGLLLALFLYVEPQEIGGALVEQVQSGYTQKGIWAMYTIIPSLGSVFSVIPLFFYPLSQEKMADIRIQLEEKRKQTI